MRAERDDVLVAIDEEGGDVTRLEVRGGSSFPGNLALGAVDDVELTRAVAAELGRRLAECGVNLNWAPSADVNSNPGNPVIGVRSFGADPDLVARHTAAYVEGLQSAGVAACTKHFPGHGDTAVDSHHALPRIDVGLGDAARPRTGAVPGRASPPAPSAVMSAHILVPALDPDRPATLSPASSPAAALRASELGYDGLIVTDGMEMQAIAATYGIERGSVLAIAAGADAICVGGGLADERDRAARCATRWSPPSRSGDLPEERLADAAHRVRALARWTAAGRGRRRRAEPRRRAGPAGRRAPTARPRGPTSAWSRPAAPCGSPAPRLRTARRRAVRRLLHPGGEHRRRRRDPLGRGRRTGPAAAGHARRTASRRADAAAPTAAGRGGGAADRRRGP